MREERQGALRTGRAGGALHATGDSDRRRWTIDPTRSTVEFEVPAYRPLRTIRGRFRRFEGFYGRGDAGAVMELTIDAASVDTGDAARDRRIRSARFLDAADHPQLAFASTLVEEVGGVVAVVGRLRARGAAVPVVFEAAIRENGDEIELDATARVDLRELGMAHNATGMMRPDATLHVATRLQPER